MSARNSSFELKHKMFFVCLKMDWVLVFLLLSRRSINIRIRWANICPCCFHYSNEWIRPCDLPFDCYVHTLCHDQTMNTKIHSGKKTFFSFASTEKPQTLLLQLDFRFWMDLNGNGFKNWQFIKQLLLVHLRFSFTKSHNFFVYASEFASGSIFLR